MTPADVLNGIVQVVGSPAWYGAWTAVGVTVSTTISIIAFHRERQPHNHDLPPQPPLALPQLGDPLKKTINIRTNFWNLFFILPPPPLPSSLESIPLSSLQHHSRMVSTTVRF
jgi:hypothetical protein